MNIQWSKHYPIKHSFTTTRSIVISVDSVRSEHRFAECTHSLLVVVFAENGHKEET